MKNRFRASLLVLLAILICAGIAGCKRIHSMTGHWIITDTSNYDLDSYPSSMTLNEDGTGITEGIACSWTDDSEILTLYLDGLGDVSYKYEWKGSTLVLYSIDNPEVASCSYNPLSP